VSIDDNKDISDIISDDDQGWVRPKDVAFGVKLGSGSYGEVFSGTLWGQAVAIKKLKRRRHDKQKKEKDLIEDLKHEIKVLKAQRHPNIVQFLAACYIAPFYCIITEYLDGGSLQTLLFEYEKRNENVSTGRVVNWAGQIARGLNWLHHNRIIHRDLKTCNILVQRPNTLKIADFGLAHIIRENNKLGRSTDCGVEAIGDHGSAGTPCYMAPEVIAEKSYGVKADVFSFGIVLLEILTLEYPYDCLSIAQGSYTTFDNAIVDGLRPPIPDDVPFSLKLLIERCWADDACKRPSMDQVIEKLNSIERRHIEKRSEIIETMNSAGTELLKEENLKNYELKRQLVIKQEQLEHLIHQTNQCKQKKGGTFDRELTKKKQFKREWKLQVKKNQSLQLELQHLRRLLEEYQSKESLDIKKELHVQQHQNLVKKIEKLDINTEEEIPWCSMSNMAIV